MKTSTGMKLIIGLTTLGLLLGCGKSSGDNSSSLMLLSGGKFIAVGESGARYSSSDGIKWTSITPGSNNYYAITYAYNRYLAVGENGARSFSSDGVTWEADQTGDAGAYTGAACGDTRCVVSGENGHLRQYDTTTDAWLSTGTSTGDTFTGMAFGETNFMLVGYNASGGFLYPSACFNTTCWDSYFFYTANRKTTTHAMSAIVYGDGKYVAVGESGYTYVLDKTGTVDVSSPARATVYDLYGVAYGNGVFVAVGLYGVGAYSSDGITWHSSTFTSGSSLNLYSIAYGNGRFVAVGNNGRTAISTDGITFPESGEGNVNTTDLPMMSGITYGQ